VRQEPIGPYVVDFVCREKRLVVEVDGGQHADNRRDAMRDQWLIDHRYRVLRFWNNEVLGNIEGVWDTIFAAASAAAPPHPDPLPASGERESPSGIAEWTLSLSIAKTARQHAWSVLRRSLAGNVVSLCRAPSEIRRTEVVGDESGLLAIADVLLRRGER